MRSKLKLLLSLSALAFLFSGNNANATVVGQPIPKGTVTGQNGFVWNGTNWVLSAFLTSGTGGYYPAGYTLGVGGVSDGSAVYVAPSGVAQNGLTIKMPSGSTALGLQLQTSTAVSYFKIGTQPAGTQFNIPITASGGFSFYTYNGTSPTLTVAPDQFNCYGAPFYGQSYANFRYYGEWSPNGQNVPTYLINTAAAYPIVLGATTTTQTGYVIDLAQPVIARSTITGPTINATTKFQANGVDGYTGAIPPGNYIYCHGGIITGYGTGSSTGLIAGSY